MGGVEATVLVRKGERGIFEEVVEEDEEFAEDGGESDFGGVTRGAEAFVEGAGDGVGTRGTKGGHVEGTTEAVSAADDVALPLEGTAVVVEGSDAEESGGLAPGHGAEFWAESQGGDGAE